MIEGILEFIESIRCDGIATCNLAKSKECGEAFGNLRGYITTNGSKVDLNEAISIYDQSWNTKLTFMSAFESFSVHCVKLHPSGKCCNPGNAGMADMLMNGITLYEFWM
jgi:hypothetical protein